MVGSPTDYNLGNGPYGIYTKNFAASRQVPTTAKVQPRAWGALACVYLGTPAS